MIENTVESLSERLEKSREKLAKLRNLREEIGSNILVESAWVRYLEEQIARLKKMGSVSSDTPIQ
jgi:ribosomal protein S13